MFGNADRSNILDLNNKCWVEYLQCIQELVNCTLRAMLYDQLEKRLFKVTKEDLNEIILLIANDNDNDKNNNDNTNTPLVTSVSNSIEQDI